MTSWFLVSAKQSQSRRGLIFCQKMQNIQYTILPGIKSFGRIAKIL